MFPTYVSNPIIAEVCWSFFRIFIIFRYMFPRLYIRYISLFLNLSNVSSLIFLIQIFAACFRSDICAVKTFLGHLTTKMVK